MATPAERARLALFPGWGPMATMFAPDTQSWLDVADRMRDLLPKQDVETGELGTYTAFYTPKHVVRLMWAVLENLGFTGGTVLEPGCGIGPFIGAAPATAAMIGVDRDPTATDIARALYPDAHIVTSAFEATRLDGGYAAAIGNVPFGDVSVHDPTAPTAVRASVHNYFIWRALHETAPGGMLVLLTSRYTMDNAAPEAREVFADLADFVGAVRLPNGALEGGTQALADIVVLRRKEKTRVGREDDTAWTQTRYFAPSVSINTYWDANPDMVLGTMREGKTNQYGVGLLVDADKSSPLEDQLTAAFTRLVEAAKGRDLLWQPPPDPAKVPIDTAGVISPEGWYEGSVRNIDGRIVRVVNGRLTPVAKVSNELRELIALRDLAVKLVTLEADHDLPDSALDTTRAAALDAYITYVKRNGAINRSTIVEDTAKADAARLPVPRPGKADRSAKRGPLGLTGTMDELTALVGEIVGDATDPDLDDFGVQEPEVTYRLVTPSLGGFRTDPDFETVAAFEVYDDETGEHRPAPILSQRQNRRVVHPTHTDDPLVALAWSLDRHGGRVDLPFIAGMLGRPVIGVTDLLGDAVYQDPATLLWVTAEEYLSGNVRLKLTVAQTAAARLDGFARNVTALEAVQPRWLEPHEIITQLGMPWIGKEYVELFIAKLLRSRASRASVTWLAETNEWEVTGGERGSALATFDWGTEDIDAYRLIELALNGKIPQVKVPVPVGDGDYVMRKDANKSMAAIEKKQQIQARFSDWLWENPDRADLLCHKYNHEHNNSVARAFDGSHITIDGLAPWFNPYDHQRSQVARSISTRGTLCGHPVGAGKTATQGMVAIKLKQLGLVRKPLLTVPKHLLEQTSRQMRQLFPGARILTWSAEMNKATARPAGGPAEFYDVADPGPSESTSAKSRRAFAARCATGDWDLVIITHPAFDALRVSEDTEADYLTGQQNDLREAIRKSIPEGQRMPKGMVKRAAKRVDGLGSKVRSLRHKVRARDAGITFEQLGIDYICVDEAHYYKNLAMPCRTDGFSVKPSKRASDLDLKLSYLRKRSRQPFATLFTGTPISNTMLELYVILHYLMPEYLERIGLGSADSWAAAYVQMQTTVEVTTDGGSFQMRTRPSLFVNAPELRMLLSRCADIRTAEQLGLVRPDVDERVIVGEPSRRTQAFSSELVERTEKVRQQGRRIEKGADNMLKICSEGRWAATDMHLVGVDDPERGKLDDVADEMVKVWLQYPDELQIGFCDVGTPNDDGPNTYGRLKELLIDRGMPAARIRFIHEAKNGSDKALMFAECRRDGGTLVILGSTDKLGVGTNIQTRCIATHDIDAPYRPSDLDQRLGRAQRPGNRNKVVLNFRYVTARTFDAYIWQMLCRKAGFITQILTGVLGRTVEDVTADQVLSYGAIKAAATGQPLLEEQARIEMDVKRLVGLRRSHQLGVERMRQRTLDLPSSIRKHRQDLRMWQDIAAAYTGEFSDGDAAALEEMAKTPWRRNTASVAGLTVAFSSWYDNQRQTQPLLMVHAGGTTLDQEMRTFHKGERFLDQLRYFGRHAASRVEEHTEGVRSAENNLEQAKASVTRVFEYDDELTAALARLDQITAELQEAAIKASRDEPLTDAERVKFAAVVNAGTAGKPAGVDARVAEFVMDLGDSGMVAELFDRPVHVPDVSDDGGDEFVLDLGADLLAEFTSMVLELDADTSEGFFAMFE